MSKTPKGGAKPPVVQPSVVQPPEDTPAKPIARPRKGGSYVVKAGKLERVAHTKPVGAAQVPEAPPPEGDDAGTSTDKQQEG